MKKKLALLLVVTSSLSLNAQDDNLVVAPSIANKNIDDHQSRKVHTGSVELDLSGAVTTGEFENSYAKDGMGGLEFAMLFSLTRKLPVDIGASFGYYWMDYESSTSEFYAPGIGDYDVESEVKGSMIPMHAVIRAYPLRSTNFFIQPYVEALAGARLFNTDQNLTTYIYDSDVTQREHFHSRTTASASYGYGLGLKVLLSRSNNLFLNLKVTELFGTETTYLDPESITLFDDGIYEYDYAKSKTNIIRFALGIHFAF